MNLLVGMEREVHETYWASGVSLDDPYVPEQEKSRVLATTKSYFELAESYIIKND